MFFIAVWLYVFSAPIVSDCFFTKHRNGIFLNEFIHQISFLAIFVCFHVYEHRRICSLCVCMHSHAHICSGQRILSWELVLTLYLVWGSAFCSSLWDSCRLSCLHLSSLWCWEFELRSLTHKDSTPPSELFLKSSIADEFCSWVEQGSQDLKQSVLSTLSFK